ncbi:hypothetical protein ACQ4PT_028754 [Festuca glaucescens]
MLQTNGPRFPVETGRRDGKVSSCADAENDLAPPNANIVDLKTYFSFKSLSWKDLVVLSGSHTIGRAECAAFAADRLYNNSGKGVQDPTLDKNNKGIFVSDQALLDDRWTHDYVARMAAAESPHEFFDDYAAAMINMGRMEVLTGDNGEIRKICSAWVD